MNGEDEGFSWTSLFLILITVVGVTISLMAPEVSEDVIDKLF